MSKDIKNRIEEKIINLFLKKIINATSRDILLHQLQIYPIGDPNFEFLKTMVKCKKFMSNYDDFIKEKMEEMSTYHDNTR